jgi:hypothetical protein
MKYTAARNALSQYLRGMGKQGQTHLDYMMVLALSNPVLLMGVRTRDLMRDANFVE